MTIRAIGHEIFEDNEAIGHIVIQAMTGEVRFRSVHDVPDLDHIQLADIQTLLLAEIMRGPSD